VVSMEIMDSCEFDSVMVGHPNGEMENTMSNTTSKKPETQSSSCDDTTKKDGPEKACSSFAKSSCGRLNRAQLKRRRKNGLGKWSRLEHRLKDPFIVRAEDSVNGALVCGGWLLPPVMFKFMTHGMGNQSNGERGLQQWVVKELKLTYHDVWIHKTKWITAPKRSVSYHCCVPKYPVPIEYETVKCLDMFLDDASGNWRKWDVRNQPEDTDGTRGFVWGNGWNRR
jgi:hypothetical protein